MNLFRAFALCLIPSMIAWFFIAYTYKFFTTEWPDNINNTLLSYPPAGYGEVNSVTIMRNIKGD